MTYIRTGIGYHNRLGALTLTQKYLIAAGVTAGVLIAAKAIKDKEQEKIDLINQQQAAVDEDTRAKLARLAQLKQDEIDRDNAALETEIEKEGKTQAVIEAEEKDKKAAASKRTMLIVSGLTALGLFIFLIAKKKR